MEKNKNSLKDLYTLRKYKDELFKRPLFSHKKFLKIVTGQDASCNQYSDLMNFDGIDINDEFKDLSFGEFFSEKIEEDDLSLNKIGQQINLPLESLQALLDEELLPWNIPVLTLKRLCLLLNLSNSEVVELIKNISINENNINGSMSTNYAARSQSGISSSKLKDSLYDANVKIAIDREKEKRDQFIASFSK